MNNERLKNGSWRCPTCGDILDAGETHICVPHNEHKSKRIKKAEANTIRLYTKDIAELLFGDDPESKKVFLKKATRGVR